MKTNDAARRRGSSPLALKDQQAISQRFVAQIWGRRWLYVLLLPGLLFYVIYIYVPYLGSVIAFQDYNPFLGIGGSPWVGFGHFQRLFTDPEVVTVVINTIVLSILQIVIAFPVPIILALMLNEVRNQFFKRSIQSLIYLPHFLSWVIIVSIWYQLFGSNGPINQTLIQSGMQKVNFLTNPDLFRPSFILQNIWKESGWSTILFLAALTGIDIQLYEAAAMDGASRWQRLWHITLPGIIPITLVILTLRLGTVLTIGFEHIFLLLNSSTESVAQVIDTFTYYRGIVNGDFSFATAVGLAKGIVGLVLVLATNRLAKSFGQGGLF
jgi:putative aldouronate transport system permease protein